MAAAGACDRGQRQGQGQEGQHLDRGASCVSSPHALSSSRTSHACSLVSLSSPSLYPLNLRPVEQTQVQPADADAFITSYSTLLRASFAASLRPKRKKADQQRARALRAAKRTVARLQRRAQQQAADGGGGDDVPDVETLVQKELAKKQGSGVKSAATAGGAGGTFRPRLPKVVGPRRGAGIEKRRKTVRRREKAVERFKAGKKRAAAAQ